MAERAGRSRKANGRGKPRDAKPGDNSGEVPAEVILRHWANIGTAKKSCDAASDTLKKRRSVLSNAYKAAKGDGLDPDVLRDLRKLIEGDHARAVLAHRDMARVIGVVVDDVAKEMPLLAPLFLDFKMPAPVNAYLAGQQSGREGAPADANPHQPGSDEFTRWLEGHTSGAEQAVEAFR
jgi:hypothetical protein